MQHFGTHVSFLYGYENDDIRLIPLIRAENMKLHQLFDLFYHKYWN